jgi:hypothetical protein
MPAHLIILYNISETTINRVYAIIKLLETDPLALISLTCLITYKLIK